MLNDSNDADAVSGTFDGMSEGASITSTDGKYSATISYVGNGDGGGTANDIKLYNLKPQGGMLVWFE